MKQERVLTYAVLTFVAFGTYLVFLNFPKLDYRKFVYDSAEVYKPEETLTEQSQSFESLVDCMKDFLPSKCFQIYKKGILEDYKIIFGHERPIAELEQCFKWVAEEKRSHLVILKTAECIFDYSKSASYLKEQESSSFTGTIRSISWSSFLMILLAIRLYSSINQTRYVKPINESSAETVQVLEKQETGEKTKDVGLIETSDDLPTIIGSAIERSTQLPECTLSKPSSIRLSVHKENNSGIDSNTNFKQFKRARTDINIHDPNKPIPSVLNHPTVDKKGYPLKRIFIPGRGWVSTKVLNLEREALFLSLSGKPVEC